MIKSKYTPPNYPPEHDLFNQGDGDPVAGNSHDGTSVDIESESAYVKRICESKTEHGYLFPELVKRLKSGWLSALQWSVETKSTRLNARVFDLRKAGYPVVDHWLLLPSGKKIKEYRIVLPKKKKEKKK